ncbi:response regulator [Roseicella sp. DB1501]|uniref:response regulator n=1 Tax=Roseicella sp. DB1501 TaxID=2730925 RepID=UPI001490D472|nr:response regulator [Roseicella sp. DB1501]NOG74170.1 response regulator [Roseicella sp. DB1501]
MTDPGLDGLRVLVVEDEAMVAMLFEDTLADLGCTVVGPAASVAEALDIIGRDTIDVALLDMDLAGEASHPVADALTARGVPFAFVSGYGAGAADGSGHAGAPIISKPFTQATFAATLGRLAGQW